jgi:protein transport protein SEC24
MSGQQYGRYQTNPPPPAGFGSFPPPPGAMPSRSSGTQGTGGFGVPPPGAAGVPPPRPLAAGQMMSSSSAASTNTGVAGYQAPPALGTYGGASSNINFNAGPAYQRPPIGGGPSAYHQAPPPAVGGGTAMYHGSTAGSYQAPPPAVSSSASQLQSQEHPAVAGGTSDRMMYGAPPPPAAGFQQQQPTAATITSSLNQMSVSSSGAGPYAPPAAVPNQGQLNPNPPSSQFYPATPSRAQLSRFQGGGQATTSSAPPTPVGHDPFYTGGGSNAYPQQPMPQQQQQQPPPLMGGQLHPGGPRPLAVQPVSTTGPGGEFRHAMHQQPASAATGAQTFMEENPDWSIKHPEEMLHFTTTQIPQSAQLSTSSKVVLGGVLRPFAQCKDEVPTITPGPSGIIRCKKCRTYVNAFVSWFDNGRRWRCNICGQPNDCPSGYFCHLGDNNERRDKYDRPELCMSVVEYLAPSEYMVRPPPPPAYFFVMDVSAQAVASGMLAHVAAAIKAAIFGGEDEQAGLPGGERTQIGFLTYDTSVQYFNLSKRGRHKDDSPPQPQMLVVADLNELFVPLPPEDLLVNLEEHKDSVEAFLEALPTMFTASPRTSVQHDSCLGPALKAAFTIMKPIGGKMLVFDTMLPTLPFDGQLKPREANPRMMGTDAETSLLRGQSTWYKDTAVEFSRAQISVDLFLTNYNYIDVATLSDLSKYTAGNLYTFPNFSSNQDGARMEAEVFHTLVRPTALEAVMRVRCTRGMRVNNFYGNFFIRGSDLLALPNCTTESVFGFTMMHEDPMCPSNVLTFQSALLYTSTNGERRIRVLTTVLPVASSAPQITQSVHADVYCHLLSKQAVDYALKNGVGAARARLLQSCVDLIKTCRSASQKTSAEDKGIPPHLELMPLMIMGLLKNTAFRGGTDVHPDERCTSFNLISNLWVDERGKAYFYPRMFRVDQMPSDAGLPAATDDARPSHEAHNMHNEVFAGDEKIRLPSMMDLTVERLNSEGIYCLENGQDAFLWVGRQADPTLVHDLFSVESLENIEYSQVRYAVMIYSIIDVFSSISINLTIILSPLCLSFRYLYAPPKQISPTGSTLSYLLYKLIRMELLVLSSSVKRKTNILSASSFGIWWKTEHSLSMGLTHTKNLCNGCFKIPVYPRSRSLVAPLLLLALREPL